MKGAAIVYHKHPASARTRFVKFPFGSVVGTEPQPSLSVLSEQPLKADENIAENVIQAVQDLFDLERSDLCFDEEFDAAVEVPGEVRPVYLLRLKTMDPPFAQVEAQGAKFIALTEARGLPDFELLLLQKAYKAIMEG